MVPQREIEEQVLSNLRRIFRAFSLYSRDIQHDYGLTMPQLVVLREVSRRREITGGELAKAVSLSAPTVTGILDRLEKRGLIRRERSGADRRRVMATVTQAGEAVLASAPPPFQIRFLDEFRKLADWEQSLILSSLQRVASMMGAGAEAGGAGGGDAAGASDPEEDFAIDPEHVG